jgi:hypothetical protein
MRVIVCCADPDDKKLSALAERALAPLGEVELVADSAFVRTRKKKAPGALVYFDASIGEDRALELAARLEGLEGCAWAVLDRAGACADPASFFFAGACDYLGPALLKAGLPPDRAARALEYAGLGETGAELEPEPEPEPAPFPGWEGLAEGEEVAVRFCYSAIGGQKSLTERIGEKRLDKLREDYAAFLESWAKECGGLVWIRETSGSLLLFPPRDEGMNPVLAAFRLLLDRAIIGYEVFRLEVPLTFRFAFHEGRTMWRKPGSTGELVSSDVNFAFHLGMKATGDGYILTSTEAERAIPASLRDLFSRAGDFEGHPLLASRRFKD